MADVHANSKFKFRRSRNPGYIPKTADLLEGELFINIADKKLYTKDEEGNVIVAIGGGGSGGGGGELGGGAIIIRPEDAVNSNGNLILSTTKVGQASYARGLSGLNMKMQQYIPTDSDPINVDSLYLEIGSKTVSGDGATNPYVEIPGKLAFVTSRGKSSGETTAFAGSTVITAKPGATWHRDFGTPVDESTLKLGDGTVSIASKEIIIGSSTSDVFTKSIKNNMVYINSPNLTLGGSVTISGLKTLNGGATSTIDVGALTSQGNTVVKGDLYVEGEIISGSPTPGPKPLEDLAGLSLKLTYGATVGTNIDAGGYVRLKDELTVKGKQNTTDYEFSIQHRNRSGEDWEGSPIYYSETFLKSTNDVYFVSKINESTTSDPTYQNIRAANIRGANGQFSGTISGYYGSFFDGNITLNDKGLTLENGSGYPVGINFFGNKSVAINIKTEADGAGLVTDYNASYTKLKDDEFIIGTSIGDGFKGVTINNVKETNAGVTVTPSVSSTTVKLIEANYGNVSPYISSTSNSISIVPTEDSKVTFSNTGVVFGAQVTTPSVQLGQATIEQTGNIFGGIWGVDLKSYINNQIANGFINITTNSVQLPDALIGGDGNVTGGVWGVDKTLKDYIDTNSGGGGSGGGPKEAVKVWTGSVTGAANASPMDITSSEDGDFRCGGKLMLKESTGAWLEYDLDCPDSASPPAGTIQFNRQIFSQNSGVSDMILAMNSMSGTKTKWSLYGHARKTYTEAWWRPY